MVMTALAPKTKTCQACGTEKRLNQFYSDKTRPDGRHPYCRMCHKATKSETALKQSKRWILKGQYGMTPEQWQDLFQRQEGRCHICRTETEDLHVDHCHVKGTIRGLLCSPCNTAIGLLQDNPAIIQRASQYVGGDNHNFIPPPFPQKFHYASDLTLEEEETVAARYAAGERAVDIGKDYGMSRAAIYKMAMRHGAPKRPQGRGPERQAWEADLAKRLAASGLTEPTSYCVPTAGKGWKRRIAPQIEEAVLARYVANDPIDAIAEQFGISTGTIYAVVKRNGIPRSRRQPTPRLLR